MTEPRAVVDVVGPQHRPNHPLKQVVVLVGRLGAREGGDAVPAVLTRDQRQAVRHKVERFFPGGFPPDRWPRARLRGVGSDQGTPQPRRVRRVVGAKPPLGTQHPIVRRSLERRAHSEDHVLPDVQRQLAAHAAVRAGASHHPVGFDHPLASKAPVPLSIAQPIPFGQDLSTMFSTRNRYNELQRRPTRPWPISPRPSFPRYVSLASQTSTSGPAPYSPPTAVFRSSTSLPASPAGLALLICPTLL